MTWTTKVPCNHILEYGTTSGVYTNSTVTTTSPNSTHSETITGLLSGTRYYYRIHLLADGVPDVTSGQYFADTTSETPPTAAQKARGVWIVGGISGSAVTSTVGAIDLYDPVNNTWYANVASAATGTYVPVSFAAYAAYNGKLYVFGGFDNTGTVRNLVQIYTISTNTWTTGAVMPQARANIFATVLNGYIYILGGTTANATSAYAVTYTPPAGCTSTIEYNVAGNTWVYTKIAFGTAGSERFSYAYDGIVYNLGGRTAAATLALTHDGLIPFTVTQPVNGELDGTGTVEVAMSAARTGFTGGFYKPSANPGFVYLVGGVSGTFVGTPACFINSGTTSAALINTVQFMHYPFAAPRTWVTGVSYPVSIAFGATVVSTALGSPRIIHFGGTQALGASASGQASGYWIPTPPDPAYTWTDSWTAISSTGMSARWGHGAVTLNQ
jgi:N-acetylneuraminic acid mutarotase